MGPASVPGFLPALRSVSALGGVLLGDSAAMSLTLAALHAARPHMQAEFLADVADDVAELAARNTSAELAELARLLDAASHQIREALT